MSEAARVVTNAQIHADGHSIGSTQTLQHGTRFAGRDPPAAAAAGDNTELHVTSTPPSNALDAIQRRPNLVELCSTLEKFHQVIPILVKKVVTLRRLVAESDSIIQQIPFYDHEATYYCLKSEELLKTCTFLLKEISKASTLQ
ncbi:uncharacterized protein V3H82_023334 isoform 1-T1 [Fundulus diaphanus]